MGAAVSSPRRIEPVFVERVWGRTNLSPLYGSFDRRIGEVWFPYGDNAPLLIKFLFTEEKLSVQVHPDDEYARMHENSRGKTEMWHILGAEPGAAIALGFRREMSREELRRAIESGSVESELNWVPVAPGDTLFAPAGVVHAIGAGLVLCEIQQNSDVTYRLYDYGRPRQLHLERGLAVARTGVWDGRRSFPVRCPYFVTERIEASEVEAAPPDGSLLICIEGEGEINGERVRAGEVWHCPAGAWVKAAGGARFLRTRAGGDV